MPKRNSKGRFMKRTKRSAPRATKRARRRRRPSAMRDVRRLVNKVTRPFGVRV